MHVWITLLKSNTMPLQPSVTSNIATIQIRSVGFVQPTNTALIKDEPCQVNQEGDDQGHSAFSRVPIKIEEERSVLIKPEVFDTFEPLSIKKEEFDEDASGYCYFTDTENDSDESELTSCDCAECLQEDIILIEADEYETSRQNRLTAKNASKTGVPDIPANFIGCSPTIPHNIYGTLSHPHRRGRQRTQVPKKVFRCTFESCDQTFGSRQTVFVHIRIRHFNVAPTRQEQKLQNKYEPLKPSLFVEETVNTLNPLTSAQEELLEWEFAKSQKLNYYEREDLAFNMKICESRIVSWFQNRRNKATYQKKKEARQRREQSQEQTQARSPISESTAEPTAVATTSAAVLANEPSPSAASHAHSSGRRSDLIESSSTVTADHDQTVSESTRGTALTIQPLPTKPEKQLSGHRLLEIIKLYPLADKDKAIAVVYAKRNTGEVIAPVARKSLPGQMAINLNSDNSHLTDDDGSQISRINNKNGHELHKSKNSTRASISQALDAATLPNRANQQQTTIIVTNPSKSRHSVEKNSKSISLKLTASNVESRQSTSVKVSSVHTLATTIKEARKSTKKPDSSSSRHRSGDHKRSRSSSSQDTRKNSESVIQHKKDKSKSSIHMEKKLSPKSRSLDSSKSSLKALGKDSESGSRSSTVNTSSKSGATSDVSQMNSNSKSQAAVKSLPPSKKNRSKSGIDRFSRDDSQSDSDSSYEVIDFIQNQNRAIASSSKNKTVVVASNKNDIQKQKHMSEKGIYKRPEQGSTRQYNSRAAVKAGQGFHSSSAKKMSQSDSRNFARATSSSKHPKGSVVVGKNTQHSVVRELSNEYSAVAISSRSDADCSRLPNKSVGNLESSTSGIRKLSHSKGRSFSENSLDKRNGQQVVTKDKSTAKSPLNLLASTSKYDQQDKLTRPNESSSISNKRKEQEDGKDKSSQTATHDSEQQSLSKRARIHSSIHTSSVGSERRQQSEWESHRQVSYANRGTTKCLLTGPLHGERIQVWKSNYRIPKKSASCSKLTGEVETNAGSPQASTANNQSASSKSSNRKKNGSLSAKQAAPQRAKRASTFTDSVQSNHSLAKRIRMEENQK